MFLLLSLEGAVSWNLYQVFVPSWISYLLPVVFVIVMLIIGFCSSKLVGHEMIGMPIASLVGTAPLFITHFFVLQLLNGASFSPFFAFLPMMIVTAVGIIIVVYFRTLEWSVLVRRYKEWRHDRYVENETDAKNSDWTPIDRALNIT